MVTDTANFRYPYYHTPEDTIDKIDFERLARVVRGLAKVVEEWRGGSESVDWLARRDVAAPRLALSRIIHQMPLVRRSPGRLSPTGTAS